jgi:putative methyltransferase (TIGR04325 family)
MFAMSTEVSILDFGGGLGIGHVSLAESIASNLHNVQYTIVEGPRVAALGRGALGDKVTYLTSVPSTGNFSLIHIASSLQYIRDCRRFLSSLSSLGSNYILLSDVFAGHIKTFATLQNYYESLIPHWFLNLDELLAVLSGCGHSLKLQRYASSLRLGIQDVLPMDKFPDSLSLVQTLALLLEKE